MSFDDCVGSLLNDDICILPTETVYGLACSAYSSTAIKKVFNLKGRPCTNPLIVHVLNHDAANEVCHTNDLSKKLAKAFWPGPLTLVLPKRKSIPNILTANLDTVGVRSPAHPEFRRILKSVDIPLAAPSANKSNKLSPTSFDNVKDEFGDNTPPILDGGSCKVGIESTVLDLTSKYPNILRHGSISKDQIQKVIGMEVQCLKEILKLETPIPNSQKSPGQFSKHYCPNTPLILHSSLIKLINIIPEYENDIIILPFKKETLNFDSSAFSILFLSENGDPNEIAYNLYNTLHEADKLNKDKIHASLFEDDFGVFSAINDRLTRASTKLI